MTELINTLQPVGIPSLTPSSISSSADTSDNESSYCKIALSQESIQAETIRSRSVSESVSDTGEFVKKTSTKRSWSADVSIGVGDMGGF